MELLTQIWQSIGGPLTYLLWVYIVIVVLVAGAGLTVFIVVFKMIFNDRKKFRQNLRGIRGKW